ncbi:MAG: PQQ-dependent sugar dehydrogenase [Anaerolineae bacterium]|nr:PQQ-dependent sugar dehydrogenase [Anaerolineae bacterium]
MTSKVRLLALLAAGALLVAACSTVPTMPTAQPADAPQLQPSPSAAQAEPARAEATPTQTTRPTLPAEARPEPEPTPSVRPALRLFVSGLVRPTDLTHAGDPRTLYVTEQPGRVRVIRDGVLLPEPFLDLTDRVGSQGNEQGLLGIAFAPDFARSRKLFVNYTNRAGDTVIAGFLARADGLSADPSSAWTVLQIDQPYANHNGGQIRFGPDGMLYIGVGDGGSAGDPLNAGQDVRTLLGKLLRIDVSNSSPSEPYRIPADNPDFGPNSRRELWAIGLRNPWRFSFDRLTGDLYIADVGQNRYEEINFQPATSRGGENYGWRLREGFAPFRGNGVEGLTDPIWQYGRDEGCSVTGGYVYRGSAVPPLYGAYLYGDFCSGRIWTLRRDGSGNWQNALLFDTDLNIASFGEDAEGELYVLDLNGAIHRIVGE